MAASSSSAAAPVTVAGAGYQDMFLELLHFNQEKDLTDLIEKQPFSFRPVHGQMKALAARIKMWNEILDKELWSNRHNHHKLCELKDVARIIFDSNTTVIIRTKLKNVRIENNSLNKALSRMEELVIRISSEKLPEAYSPRRSFVLDQERAESGQKLKVRDIVVSSFSRSKSETDLSVHYSAVKPTKKADDIFAHTIADNKHKELKLQLLSNRFAMLCSEYLRDWLPVLLQEFSLLTTIDQVASVAKGLSLAQSLTILQNAFTKKCNVWKLPYFIVSIPVENLERVVLSLEENDIHFLNRALRKQPQTANSWMNKKFNQIRQRFVDILNEKNTAINELAKTFRDHRHPNLLNASDLRDIDNLKSDIMFHRHTVNRMRVLIHNVFHNPETNHVLWAVQDEYRKFYMRLSSEPADIQKCIGNIFGTIHRNIFEQNFTEDDDEAYEIFGAWAICSVDDYREVGLLQNLSQDEFEKIKSEQTTEIYRIAVNNLKKIGIEHVIDWKRLHIFNRYMLSNYINRPEISQVLRA